MCEALLRLIMNLRNEADAIDNNIDLGVYQPEDVFAFSKRATTLRECALRIEYVLESN